MAENKSEINPRSVRQSPGLSRHKQPVQLGSQMYALGKHEFATEERIQGEKSLLSIGCILKFAPFLPGELVDNQSACRTAANGEAGIGNKASDTVGIIGQKTAPAILDITAVAQLMECRDIAFSADAEMRTEAEPCNASNAERSSLCAEADPGDFSRKVSSVQHHTSVKSPQDLLLLTNGRKGQKYRKNQNQNSSHRLQSSQLPEKGTTLISVSF